MCNVIQLACASSGTDPRGNFLLALRVVNSRVYLAFVGPFTPAAGIFLFFPLLNCLSFAHTDSTAVCVLDNTMQLFVSTATGIEVVDVEANACVSSVFNALALVRPHHKPQSLWSLLPRKRTSLEDSRVVFHVRGVLQTFLITGRWWLHTPHVWWPKAGGDVCPGGCWCDSA